MPTNQELGRFSEAIAAKYLSAKGYRIIETNKQVGHEEIDILAKFGDKLIFIEVKSRQNGSFEEIEEGLTRHKLRHLKQAINRYIYRREIDPDQIRLDFLAINIDTRGKVARIKHFEDII